MSNVYTPTTHGGASRGSAGFLQVNESGRINGMKVHLESVEKAYYLHAFIFMYNMKLALNLEMQQQQQQKIEIKKKNNTLFSLSYILIITNVRIKIMQRQENKHFLHV